MKNSTHKEIEFLGMGKKLPMPYALCPMPHAAGRLSLSSHKGMEFRAAFDKIGITKEQFQRI
jgi:hypothetical protein